jgi:hypothetical protein
MHCEAKKLRVAMANRLNGGMISPSRQVLTVSRSEARLWSSMPGGKSHQHLQLTANATVHKTRARLRLDLLV